MAIIPAPVAYAGYTTENIYKVPASQWRKWSAPARGIFNFLYGTTTGNKNVVCGIDLFGTSEQTEAVLNATIWNMAWEAAGYVNDYTKKQKSKN
jgi:hypothetical protein